MSAGFVPVLWNKFKYFYDLIAWLAIVSYLVAFSALGLYLYPAQNINTVLIRATGSAAIILLHVILLIGPLSRLNKNFLPLLYNRRHLGVSMFILALLHAILAINWYHGHGNSDVLKSIFISNINYGSITIFPFEVFGFVALLILGIMATTSHDFWLAYLSPKIWKSLHIMVYLAYFLLILHVVLGVLQFEKGLILMYILFFGMLLIAGFHLWAAFREENTDRVIKNNQEIKDGNWLYVCKLDEIQENRAKITVVGTERVAVFKYNNSLSAVHNVCKHQLGPIGEGEIIDGCITCPWHGFQYKPEDGRSPAPFKEKLSTYKLMLISDKIYVANTANEEGTYEQPVTFNQTQSVEKPNEGFFVGWREKNGNMVSFVRNASFVASCLILVLGVVLSASQSRFTPFAIDYNKVTNHAGWLTRNPVPSILVDTKNENGQSELKRILIVDGFKFGAAKIVDNILGEDSLVFVQIAGYDSKDFSKGTLTYRVMELEDHERSIQKETTSQIKPSMQTSVPKDTILSGQIIDPKCYFGAMNPGEGKTHKACAVRCLSGGIMPVFRYSDGDQFKYAVLKLTTSEKSNGEYLNFVGDSVTIKGEISQMDNWELISLKEQQIVRVKKYN
ncbi:MAG: Rieske 2Fe-2S domain-containing protein [Cytophagales bacterium]